MKVILLAHTKGIGREGEIKDVPDGYAQNFLIPKKIAVVATPERIAKLNSEKARIETEKNVRHELLSKELAKLNGASITIMRKVNSSGSLFASITEKDIREELRQAYNVSFPEAIIHMKEHIKHTGISTVTVGEKGDSYDVQIEVKGQ